MTSDSATKGPSLRGLHAPLYLTRAEIETARGRAHTLAFLIAAGLETASPLEIIALRLLAANDLLTTEAPDPKKGIWDQGPR